MNTLPRAVTAHVLGDTEAYTALRARWSALVQSERRHELTAAHHLLYLALVGKDWRRAFTPPSNRRKLENGAFEGWVLFRALGRIRGLVDQPQLLAPFEGIVTPQALRRLRELLPMPSPYGSDPEHWPAFAAYRGEASDA